MKSDSELIASFFYDLNNNRSSLIKRILKDKRYLNSLLMVKTNRRDFNKALVSLLINAGIISITGCSGFLSNSRIFKLRKVPFKYSYSGFIRDIAFRVVSRYNDHSIDYNDNYCPKCSEAMRNFLTAYDIFSTVVTIACPYCSFATRMAMAAGSTLASMLIKHEYSEAVALPINDGFNVIKVASSIWNGSKISVRRSTMCYDVYNHEPQEEFNRKIWALPKQIVYFTDVLGFNAYSKIYHKWYKNGMLTDNIPLEIKSSSYRTFSRKRNLAKGQWIVTTEAPNEDLIDSKEFSISE